MNTIADIVACQMGQYENNFETTYRRPSNTDNKEVYFLSNRYQQCWSTELKQNAN